MNSFPLIVRLVCCWCHILNVFYLTDSHHTQSVCCCYLREIKVFTWSQRPIRARQAVESLLDYRDLNWADVLKDANSGGGERTDYKQCVCLLLCEKNVFHQNKRPLKSASVRCATERVQKRWGHNPPPDTLIGSETPCWKYSAPSFPLIF